MAIGDGSGWDETTPTDATTAIQIDDYNRDLRVGVSARMRFEHEWPASQSATSEGGKHKWITFQAQSTKPTLSGTQVAAIYSKTDDNLYFEKSAGGEVTIVSGTAVGDGKVLVSATDTAAGYLVDAIDGTTIALVSTTAGSEAIGVGNILGAWTTSTANTSVQVTRDSLAICVATAAGYEIDILGYTDSSNPPTTLRGRYQGNTFESGWHGSVTLPIRKNEYFKFVTSNTAVVHVIAVGL